MHAGGQLYCTLQRDWSLQAWLYRPACVSQSRWQYYPLGSSKLADACLRHLELCQLTLVLEIKCTKTRVDDFVLRALEKTAERSSLNPPDHLVARTDLAAEPPRWADETCHLLAGELQAATVWKMQKMKKEGEGGKKKEGKKKKKEKSERTGKEHCCCAADFFLSFPTTDGVKPPSAGSPGRMQAEWDTGGSRLFPKQEAGTVWVCSREHHILLALLEQKHKRQDRRITEISRLDKPLRITKSNL